MSNLASGNGNVQIKKEKFAEILETLGKDNIVTAFEDNGFDIRFDKDGNINYLEYREAEASEADDFLRVIAGYVDNGSLEFTSEGGDIWTYEFVDGELMDTSENW